MPLTFPPKIPNLLLWLAFIALNTVTQLAFKAAGDTLDGRDGAEQFMTVALTSPAVGLAVACYIGVFVIWIALLQTAPLSRAFLVTALVYIPVTLGAWAMFGEALSWGRVGGIALIVAGVAMLGIQSKRA